MSHYNYAESSSMALSSSSQPHFHSTPTRESLPLTTASTQTCGSCDYVLRYPLGTPWASIYPMVKEHYRQCPTPHYPNSKVLENTKQRKGAKGGKRRRVKKPSEELLGPKLKQQSMSASRSPGLRSMSSKKKNMMDVNARKKMLEEDVWAGDVTRTSVRCLGCGQIRKLDRRSDYYPGLWLKHRSKCKKIIEKEKARSREKKQVFGANMAVGLGEVSDNYEDADMDEVEDDEEYSMRRSSPASSLYYNTDKLPEDAREKRGETPSSSGSLSEFRYDARYSSVIAGGTDVPPARDTEDGDSEYEMERASVVPPQTSGPVPPTTRYEQFRSDWARLREGSNRPNNDIHGGYWAHAPFTSSSPGGRGDQSEEPVPRAGGSLYRCSTYLELATNFQEATRMMRQLIDGK
ncbi:hypothetical protein BDQ17DRAFT_1546701 [Cyathus striatus]|nr:hypothetical protein BDQ17DRAFT_1546701 [Cyathus striatus]